MSEYAEILIEKMELAWFRNYLDGNIVSLFFSDKDLVITENCVIDADIEEASTYTKYEYRTTVKCAKERLDSQGYGINNLKKLFNERVFQAIDYEPFLHNLRVDYELYDKITVDRIEKNVTFRKWQNSVKKITLFQLENDSFNWRSLPGSERISTECDKLIAYAMSDGCASSFYGLKSDVIAVPYVYRAILEYCSETSEIVLDFSDIQYWDSDCISKALKAACVAEKTIVLVEGNNDKDILEFALDHFYPHLADLFYFMDFDDDCGGSRDGGCSYLVKNMKTFYFSKINARFVAIFDNDAEGYSSKCTLLNDIRQWPDNFRILNYPSLDFLRSYPTIVPNGTVVADSINNKAASIELYLPDDLIQEDGEFIPIEWESRKKIKKRDGDVVSLYQGVISQKKKIDDAFNCKKNQIKAGEKPFVQDEWGRMKELLTSIVFAFNKEQD